MPAIESPAARRANGRHLPTTEAVMGTTQRLRQRRAPVGCARATEGAVVGGSRQREARVDARRVDADDAWDPDVLDLERFLGDGDDAIADRLGAYAVRAVRDAFGPAPHSEDADGRLRALNAACLLLAQDDPDLAGETADEARAALASGRTMADDRGQAAGARQLALFDGGAAR
jgi:hypothetical protein